MVGLRKELPWLVALVRCKLRMRMRTAESVSGHHGCESHQEKRGSSCGSSSSSFGKSDCAHSWRSWICSFQHLRRTASNCPSTSQQIQNTFTRSCRTRRSYSGGGRGAIARNTCVLRSGGPRAGRQPGGSSRGAASNGPAQRRWCKQCCTEVQAKPSCNRAEFHWSRRWGRSESRAFQLGNRIDQCRSHHRGCQLCIGSLCLHSDLQQSGRHAIREARNGCQNCIAFARTAGTKEQIVSCRAY